MHVMWCVRADVDAIGVRAGDFLSSYECGRAVAWLRRPLHWQECEPADVGLDAIAGWWAAGLIAPASLEDGDVFRSHELLHAVTAAPRHPWAA